MAKTSYGEGREIDPERAEKFLRLLQSKDRPRDEILQTVARFDAGKARRIPTRDSVAQAMHSGNPRIEQYEDTAPARVKRSRTERLDSMINRLKDLPPELLEAKIKEIQGEFWNIGMPVTYDDLRAVAASYLNRRGVDRNYTPEVTRK